MKGVPEGSIFDDLRTKTKIKYIGMAQTTEPRIDCQRDNTLQDSLRFV